MQAWNPLWHSQASYWRSEYAHTLSSARSNSSCHSGDAERLSEELQMARDFAAKDSDLERINSVLNCLYGRSTAA